LSGATGGTQFYVSRKMIQLDAQRRFRSNANAPTSSNRPNPLPSTAPTLHKAALLRSSLTLSTSQPISPGSKVESSLVSEVVRPPTDVPEVLKQMGRVASARD
jgi:hypothetical protein